MRSKKKDIFFKKHLFEYFKDNDLVVFFAFRNKLENKFKLWISKGETFFFIRVSVFFTTRFRFFSIQRRCTEPFYFYFTI